MASDAGWRVGRSRPAASGAVGAVAFAACAQGHSESARNNSARRARAGGAWRGDLLDQPEADASAADRATGNSADDHRVLAPGSASATGCRAATTCACG